MFTPSACLLLLVLAPAEDPTRSAPADAADAFVTAASRFERERARRVLVGRGREALPALQRAASSADPATRERVAFTLAWVEHPLAVTTLAALTDDPAPEVITAALDGLAEHGPPAIPDAALAAAGHREWSVRRAAARCLGATPDPRAVDALVVLRSDVDPDVRAAAIQALAVSPAPGAGRALAECLVALGPVSGAPLVARLPLRVDPIALPALEAILALGPGAAALREASAADLESDAPSGAQGIDQEAGHDVPAHSSAGPVARRPSAAGAIPRDPAVASMLAAAASEAALRLTIAGRPPTAGPIEEFVVRGAADGDPGVRLPAIATLVQAPERAADAVLRVLPIVDGPAAESLARLLVRLRGPGARPDLLAIARGDRTASPSAVAGSIAALRWFRTEGTTEDLAWIYAVDLPRRTREELCAAFEDLPRSAGARSGLLSALRDGDPSLRLRAFRVLLQYGASSEEQIGWLLARIAEEEVDWVRQRMARLLASHAEGEGARVFAARLVRQLADADARMDAPGITPDASSRTRRTRDDAIDALENLAKGPLQAEVADAILDAGVRSDARMLRLFTRLDGARADAFVADALGDAIARGDDGAVRPLLLALRHGGGPRTLRVARELLRQPTRSPDGPAEGPERLLQEPAGDLADEALRVLLQRGDAEAIAVLHERYATFDLDERNELITSVRLPDGDVATAALRALLVAERDPVIVEILLTRVAEVRAPLHEEAIARTAEGTPLRERVRAIETLGSLGGAAARERLHALLERIEPSAVLRASPDALLEIESTARAAARAGDIEHAPLLARLLFCRLPALALRQDDTDAAFPFEATIARALVDLAQTTDEPRAVAGAVEQELDRLAEVEELYLYPKALFLRLGKALDDAPPALRTLRAELDRLALRIPPRPDRRELLTAIRLAEFAGDEGDHASAAVLLDRAIRLVDLHGVDGPRILKEHYGAPDPVAGIDPVLRLRAEVLLARARAVQLAAPRDAEALYLRAADAAPRDAWLHLGIAGELLELKLDVDLARALARRAADELRFDGAFTVRVARVLAEAGDEEGFDAAHARHVALRDCGLVEDLALHRIGVAEALVRLGRNDAARTEAQRAIELDPDTRRLVADDPTLAALLRD